MGDQQSRTVDESVPEEEQELDVSQEVTESPVFQRKVGKYRQLFQNHATCIQKCETAKSDGIEKIQQEDVILPSTADPSKNVVGDMMQDETNMMQDETNMMQDASENYVNTRSNNIRENYKVTNHTFVEKNYPDLAQASHPRLNREHNSKQTWAGVL